MHHPISRRVAHVHKLSAAGFPNKPGGGSGVMNVLVTGGGTRAPIDDVRSIVNTSTGLFSSQLTEAFLEQGAHVWHVCAPQGLRPFARMAAFDLDAQDAAAERARLDTLRMRWRAVRDRLTLRLLNTATVDNYAATLHDILTQVAIDVIVLAMAVGDYEPQAHAGKLDSTQPTLTIVCRQTPKVINRVRDWAPRSFLVGFKLVAGASRDALISAARQALVSARADLIVANDLRLVHTPQHAIHLVDAGTEVETIGPCADVAGRLVRRIVDRFVLSGPSCQETLA